MSIRSRTFFAFVFWFYTRGLLFCIALGLTLFLFHLFVKGVFARRLGSFAFSSLGAANKNFCTFMPHSGKSLCPSSESFWDLRGQTNGIYPLYMAAAIKVCVAASGGEVRTSKTRLLDAFGVIKFYIVAVSVAVFQSLSTSTHVFRAPKRYKKKKKSVRLSQYGVSLRFWGNICSFLACSVSVPIFQAERASLPVLSSLPTDSFPKLSNFRTHWKLQSTSQSPSQSPFSE